MKNTKISLLENKSDDDKKLTDFGLPNEARTSC